MTSTIRDAYADDDIDTSAAFAELCELYERTGESVEVDFRSMVNWVRLGDQLTHQIHPYPAKLLPNIAHFFVRAKTLNRTRKLVLDPFCGSGTVALEASAAGHSALVADANPLALLIAKAKTTPYDADLLRECTQSVVARAARFKTAPEIEIVNAHLWYTPDRKRALERISRAILEVENLEHRDFLRVCLSVVARKMSFADPAISVPVRLRVKESLGAHHSSRVEGRLKWLEDANALTEFARICESNIDRVADANLARPGRTAAIAVGIDARNLRDPAPSRNARLRSNSVPLIITSPPYGSAQKYVRATSLSLNWLDLALPSDLASLEARSIGREHLPNHRYKALPDTLPPAYAALCRRIAARNEIRGKITAQYLCDLKSALAEMSRVTAKGGHIVLVIGNNEVCGETLRNDQFACHVLQEFGMTVKLKMLDHIKSRGLMTKRNKTASLISRESVLVFSK
jgi:tRNA G10  N-methylase Trm11